MRVFAFDIRCISLLIMPFYWTILSIRFAYFVQQGIDIEEDIKTDVGVAKVNDIVTEEDINRVLTHKLPTASPEEIRRKQIPKKLLQQVSERGQRIGTILAEVIYEQVSERGQRIGTILAEVIYFLKPR
jgi:hypothetical protein